MNIHDEKNDEKVQAAADQDGSGEREPVKSFLESIAPLWENWNLQALTQQDWSELYVERSRWHSALDETGRYLSEALQRPEEEHETILYLLRAQQELLLCLQEVYFTDLLRESELEICRKLEESYALAAEQTAWDQKLARKKNALRMAVLEHQLGEDRKCRRMMRTACELPVAGSELRNVREFAACYEQQAVFETHLPVEGFQYPKEELQRLDEALEAFLPPMQSLTADYVLYNGQEKALLQDLFAQLLYMTAQDFSLHTKAGDKEGAVSVLRRFTAAADRAPAQLRTALKGNLWYVEASFAWLLTQSGRVDEADAFLKTHLCRPEQVREELAAYASDAALLAQITDFLYFCYYVIYMKKYPLAVSEWKEFREHLSTESFIAAREIIDGRRGEKI